MEDEAERPAMSTFARDEDRRVVPRWRFLSDRMPDAELSGDPRFEISREYDPTYLAQRISDWEHAPSLAAAADLVTGAWTTGDRAKAVDAAEYLLTRRKLLVEGVASLAERYLGRTAVSASHAGHQRSLLLPPDFASRAMATVRAARKRISRNARNAEAWLDMSRAYAIIGQKDLSERAMTRALMVAPDHRMVLRAAARLYVHLHDAGRAAKLLSQHPRTRVDPWLLAPEIAIASITDKTSKHIRAARSLVTSKGLPPAHLAELHSALATVDFDRGEMRYARRHARESLVAPNDNCVAQARWLAVRHPEIIVTNAAFELAQSYEARCWRSLRDGDWNGAIAESHGWLLDEPYSSRPAVIGSFIGVTLTEDYAFGGACARVGIQADPASRPLRNNLAVALAYLGEQTEAEQQYRMIAKRFDNDFPEYVYQATGGLIQFRAGDVAAARALYTRAMELAPDSMRTRVLAYWLREELHFSPRSATEALLLCDKALLLSKRDPFTTRLVQLVRAQAERAGKFVAQLPGSDHAVRSRLEAARMMPIIKLPIEF
jgi:tetratricopeptide (TPR) repeat protein